MLRFLAVLLVATGGCATVFARPTQEVKFHSEPPGAVFHVAGKNVTAPGAITLASNQNHLVKLPTGETFTIRAKGNLWWLANLFWFPAGTAVGGGVDIATKAYQRGLEHRYLLYKNGFVYGKDGQIVHNTAKGRGTPKAPARK